MIGLQFGAQNDGATALGDIRRINEDLALRRVFAATSDTCWDTAKRPSGLAEFADKPRSCERDRIIRKQLIGALGASMGLIALFI